MRVQALHKIVLALNRTFSAILDFAEFNDYTFEDEDESALLCPFRTLSFG